MLSNHTQVAGREHLIMQWEYAQLAYTEQISVEPKMRKGCQEKPFVLTSLSLSSLQLPVVAAIKEGSGWSDPSHPILWLALLKHLHCVSWHFSQHRARRRRRDETQVVWERHPCVNTCHCPPADISPTSTSDCICLYNFHFHSVYMRHNHI